MQFKNEYTVSEIAEIFQTEPETVRKWIKGGKLEATKGNSNKEGMRVSESSLQDFLSENSVKYSKTAFITATAAILTGGVSLAASLIINANRDKRNLSEIKIKSSDMIKLLEEELNQEKRTVSEKKALLESLEKEISEKNERIISIQQMISELKDNVTPKEIDEIKKKNLTVGGISGNRKMRLGRVHKKKTSDNEQGI